ncbi:hypothetical protein CDEF62S_04313 [Castellaniella defragrans]
MKRVAATVFLAGLMGLPALALPLAASAAVSVGVGVGPGGVGADISIGTEPPPLPVYEQPVAPAPGYIWTPGYWAWAPQGYFYWVDGAWVLPPAVGLLWTPGWWGWNDGFYRWHPGYWGPEVGFYGGINYGYGYFGVGYGGGYWRDRHFYYNTAVSRVNVTNIHNTYVDKTVIRNVTVNHVSYNGGRGGIVASPNAQQRAYDSRPRVAATRSPDRSPGSGLAQPGPAVRHESGPVLRRCAAPARRAGEQAGVPVACLAQRAVESAWFPAVGLAQ